MERAVRNLLISLAFSAIPAWAWAQDGPTINQISGVVVTVDDATAIVIEASESPTFSIYRLDDPACILVDYSILKLRER